LRNLFHDISSFYNNQSQTALLEGLEMHAAVVEVWCYVICLYCFGNNCV